MATNIVSGLMESASNFAKSAMDNAKPKKKKPKKSKVYGEDYDDPTEELTEANLAGVKKRKKSAQRKKLGKLAAKSVASYTRQSSGAYSPARKLRKGKY